tara:strand:+ start:48372 stop:49655 length:1284 start_codon:yes stop_codon:yes gene_type:complete
VNIVMLTNTYSPHIGGVARSIAAFANALRERHHQVLVVAPEFPGQPATEEGVLRIPAIQNFNGSDFSVALPVSGLLSSELNCFRPDIVHAHHPFLLGMTALRIARYRNLPLVFTHHTLYERYTHYVPADSATLRRFVIELATHYGNLANQVFAPSESIATLLRQRGVLSPIDVVPTGVQTALFAEGNGRDFRRANNIPDKAFVVGHLGRLAPEKNLVFLARAVADFIGNNANAHFLIAGVGPLEKDISALFEQRGLAEKYHAVGTLAPKQQSDAYHAMDVFAFSSKTETQGMVLTEAMAAGVPVVALDASGAREVVKDGENGCLLQDDSVRAYSTALTWVMQQTESKRRAMKNAALKTAEIFSMDNSVTSVLACYKRLLNRPHEVVDPHYQRWLQLQHLIRAEWEILESIADSAGSALNPAPRSTFI